MKFRQMPLLIALAALFCACGPRDSDPADSPSDSDASMIPVPMGDGGLTDADSGCLSACPAEVSCGEIDDGCGGTIDCGMCGDGLGCDEGQCVPCEPSASCESMGFSCGEIDDGCGHPLDCGACGEDEVCRDGACEYCAALTCDDVSLCGEIDDGCDGVIKCGCPAGELCEGGECVTCEPLTCAEQDATCGEIDDGCGGTITCGTCEGEGERCVAGRCQACVPFTTLHCAALGISCGEMSDGCGGTIECGFCEAPNTCAHSVCACEPLTCADQGATCGEVYDGCGAFISCGPACPDGESETIRLLAGNLTTGNRSTYDLGHGIRIFQGLRPHVALIQEFKYGDNSERARRAMVEEAFGSRFFHRVEGIANGTTIPNGVVSYFPIKAWGTLEDNYVGGTRDHVWARLDIPGEKDLWVISVHLSTTAYKRANSAEDLVSQIASLAIPPGDLLVIGGDFNTKKRTDNALTALKSVVVIDSDSTCPIDQQNNGGTNINREHPYDALYGNAALNALQTTVVIEGASSLTARGLVFDSRKFTPLSAVAPVLQGDSGGENMQHMAVIKDYALPR